jgi:hypothetical protein
MLQDVGHALGIIDGRAQDGAEGLVLVGIDDGYDFRARADVLVQADVAVV